jgi:type IV pilus assembly protein PilV
MKNISKIRNSARKSQRGIGLIDVMVAIFIFSVGLLAISALQLINKQSNYEAIQRTSAAMLANDIIERMRMNSRYVGAGTSVSSLSYYVASGTVLTHDQTVNKTTGKPATSCVDNATDCTEQDLANWDLYEWRLMLAGGAETDKDDDTKNLGGLLEPTACLNQVSGSPYGPGDYRITIAWRGQARLDNKCDPAKVSSDPDYIGCQCGDSVYDSKNEYRRILRMDAYLDVSDE